MALFTWSGRYPTWLTRILGSGPCALAAGISNFGIVDLDVVQTDRERRLAGEVTSEVDGEIGAVVGLGRGERPGEGLWCRADLDDG